MRLTEDAAPVLEPALEPVLEPVLELALALPPLLANMFPLSAAAAGDAVMMNAAKK